MTEPNPEFDAKLKEALSINDVAKRKEVMKDVEQFLLHLFRCGCSIAASRRATGMRAPTTRTEPMRPASESPGPANSSTRFTRVQSPHDRSVPRRQE